MRITADLRDEHGHVAGCIEVDTAPDGGVAKMWLAYKGTSGSFYFPPCAGRVLAETMAVAFMPPPVRVRVQTADEAAALARGRKVAE